MALRTRRGVGRSRARAPATRSTSSSAPACRSARRSASSARATAVASRSTDGSARRRAAGEGDGAAKESNLPTAGLPRLPGFEGRSGHQALAAPRVTLMLPGRPSTSRPTTAPGTSPARSAATATSRPPDVVASHTRLRCHSSTSSAKRANVSACARLRRLPPETASPSRRSASTPSSAGTAAASTSAARPLASASSRRCPSRPKPVTSVIAWAPAASAARDASALSVVIVSTARPEQLRPRARA